MKKILPLIALCACTLTLVSCGTTSSTSTNGDSAEMDSLRNSQPKTRADIMGTVKSSTGNDFTIETIDMGESDIGKEMQDPNFRTKMQSMTDAERQAWMTKMQEARANAKKVLVDVTIPVGVPILVRPTGGFGGGFPRGGMAGAGGRSTGIGSSLNTNTNATIPTQTGKQGTIADIKVGSSVNIWLSVNTGNRKIASWVSTSAGQTTNGGGGNGGGAMRFDGPPPQ